MKPFKEVGDENSSDEIQLLYLIGILLWKRAEFGGPGGARVSTYQERQVLVTQILRTPLFRSVREQNWGAKERKKSKLLFKCLKFLGLCQFYSFFLFKCLNSWP